MVGDVDETRHPQVPQEESDVGVDERGVSDRREVETVRRQPQRRQEEAKERLTQSINSPFI